MKAALVSIALGAAAVLPGFSAFPLNAKKAPASQDDLMVIQATLQAALPKAKAATVCIDLGEGSGSGVIVSKDGLVMTAAHVSGGVGKDVKVVMPDGTKLKAETLGLVAEKDAALIRITEKNPGGGDFPFVEINREDDTKLGDWIFSLGHSGGFDKDRGAVLRLARLVRIANYTVQTDGTLIGGDSGGPLFGLDGRLVGINSSIGVSWKNNNHAGVDGFREDWDRLVEGQTWGTLQMNPLANPETPVLGIGMEMMRSRDAGVRIQRVEPNSPAAAAGVRVGDVIRSVDGELGREGADLQQVLVKREAGDKVKLGILRGDGKVEIEVGLVKREELYKIR